MFEVKYKNDRGELKIFDRYENIEDAYDAVDNLVERSIMIVDTTTDKVIYKETW